MPEPSTESVAFLSSEGADDTPVIGVVESFAGGEDDFRRPTLIDPDQCQLLVNVVVRDNYEAWTRPGADAFAAQIAEFPIQALRYFETPENKYLLAVCNGVLKACSGENQAWADVDAETTFETDAAVEIEQGVDLALISDGTNALCTVDGDLALTECGTTASDPPTGATILCWQGGRMFAAGFAGGSAGKERDAIWVSNRLAFGDGQWNGTTRSFRVGSGDGDPIMALRAMQGFTLAVLKANSIWIVNADPTQEPVNFSTSADVQSLGFGVGCVGKRAAASVSNDLFFMAADGVRSVQRMQAAAGQWQLSAPISQPVQQYIDRINPNVRSIICAAAFKEFVMFAIPLDSSTSNNAVLVFNTRLGRWLGCWTGWSPLQFAVTRFASVPQLMFGDSDGYAMAWKDGDDSNNNATYFDNGQAYPTKIWTRAWDFGLPANSKSAYNCALWFTAGSAAATVKAMLDRAESRRFSATTAPTGDILGAARLPFTLASIKPTKVQRSLRALPRFQEAYLAIESTSGWLKLRRIMVSAFVNPLDG